jgi:hypothetical protein
MRAGPFAVVCTLLAAERGPRCGALIPSDIKGTFFNGQPFTASAPGGIKFKMTFTPDGKMTREPLVQSGYKNTGTW